MPFDPSLLRPIDRIRSVLGDTSATVEGLRGEDERYGAILAAASSETAAIIAAAEAWYAELSLEAVKTSAEGVSNDFTPRLAHLERVIRRYTALLASTQPGAPGVARPSVSVRTEATW